MIKYVLAALAVMVTTSAQALETNVTCDVTAKQMTLYGTAFDLELDSKYAVYKTTRAFSLSHSDKNALIYRNGAEYGSEATYKTHGTTIFILPEFSSLQVEGWYSINKKTGILKGYEINNETKYHDSRSITHYTGTCKKEETLF